MNNKGQESATFELLVVAIMGLAILTIVLGISDYFSNLRFQASEKTFYDSFSSSVNSPNGDVVVAKNILFLPGKKTSLGLAKYANLPEGCITIQASDSSAWVVNPDGTMVDIPKSTQADVYFKCVLGDDYISISSDACDISCLVSFGEEIPQD